MTLSGNYNHVCSGPAAPAQPCHITLQGSDMSRLSLQQGMAMGDPSLFPSPPSPCSGGFVLPPPLSAK